MVGGIVGSQGRSNLMVKSGVRMDFGTFSLQQQEQHVATAMQFSAEDTLKETIHSGHFMMSNVPQDEEDVEGSAETVNSVECDPTAVPNPQRMMMGGNPGLAGMDINPVGAGRVRSNSDPMSRFDASRLSINQRKVIDSSLSKLFECMTLAYRAKLTSPKWNNFKGLKLRWTIKIRLNNVIWRAWHMQFVKQVRPLIAPFAIEVDPSPHNKAEAVVLEGKYWKRKQSIVSAEYRRWRVYYRDKANGVSPQNALAAPPGSMEANVANFLERYGERYADAYGVNASNWLPQQDEEPMMTEDFNFPPDFTDALLARLTNQPFAFPNPREIAQAGNADFIQPGLLQLQPSLDDLMDTLEPLQDFFANSSGFGGLGSQFSSYGFGGNVGGGAGDAMNAGSDLGGMNADIYPSSAGYWRPNLNEAAVNEAIQNRLSSLQQMQGGYNSATQQLQQVQQQQQQLLQQQQQQQQPFQLQVKSSHMNAYPIQTTSNCYLASASNPPYDPYGNAVSPAGPSSHSNNYGQHSAYSVQSYGSPSSMVSSPGSTGGATGNRPTIQVSTVAQDQATAELRKEMKARSMSGPINGQPLIDPAVLGNLANYNRSASVSNGNLAYLQPKDDIMRAAASAARATTSAKNPKKTSNVSFAIPQAVTKVARNARYAKPGKGSVPSSVHNQPQQPHPIQPSRLDTTYHPQSSGSSTLAQLLTGGSPFSVSVVPPVSPVQTTPHFVPSSTKKLAPKPAIKTETSSVSASLKAGSPNVSPFTIKMASPMSQQSSVSTLSVNLESPPPPSRQTDIVPKMEFTGSQDHSRYRLKSEEPDPRNPRNVEHKRINHISAEQKRRGHIKSGFEVLHGLVPSLAQNSSVKVSKAVVLHKGAEYIRHLKEERRAMQTEAETLREQIETINQAVILCQQQLPATGAPVSSRARNDRMNEMMDDYIRLRTQQNWKFWLFSHIVRPLFENFVSSVSTRSVDDMCRSTSSWVDQQCTLVQLRPLIKDSMRKLSTTTHVLSDPSRLPDEARAAVQKTSSSGSSSSSSTSHLHSASSLTHR